MKGKIVNDFICGRSMIAVVAASIPVVKVFEKPPTPEVYQVEVTQEESEIEEYEIELSEESPEIS